MMTQWRYAAATGYCWFPYAGPFIFDSEGIKDIKYRSIDGLGVEENPSRRPSRSDKTPPVVTVTSPQHDGFYLTSDTLTLDFRCSTRSPRYTRSAQIWTARRCRTAGI